MIVTFAHLRTIPHFKASPGFCRSHSAAFFRKHGLDWRQFVRHGIEASKLEATGDGLALELVAWARKCQEGAQHG